MPTPRITLDGQMAYGVTAGSSGVIQINGVNYIATEITPTRNVQQATDYVADGGVGRQRMTADFDTLTMNLQLATASTAYPKFGDTFTMTLDANYGVETWIVQPVSVTQTNSAGDIRMLSINCRKAYGTVTTVN